MKEKIIQQGAEAVLIRRGEILLKRRVEKGYRLNELDEKLRRTRTRGEVKLVEKASKVIFVPRIIKLDAAKKEIEMEFIDGQKLSEELDGMKNWEEICFAIGESIAQIHDVGIIHGDLTTSNMLWKDRKLYFIDFGLGYFSRRTEDKAVDLHLIKQALEAKHFKNYEKMFQRVLEGYKSSQNFPPVFRRFEEVERRGRYKAQY